MILTEFYVLFMKVRKSTVDNRFKVFQTSKMDMEFLRDCFKEIEEEGDGFVLVYRNKLQKRYWRMSSGFTNEEGVFAAHIIINDACEGLGGDDPDGGKEIVIGGEL